MPKPWRSIPTELAALLAPRVMRRVTENGDGCWIRDASVKERGYTTISHTADGEKTYYLAHRVMYAYANGPIAEGMTIDHLCNQPRCCNPDHLEAVPMRANVLRSQNNPFAVNARKEKCIRGHAFVPHPRGGRYCPECKRIRQAEYTARKQAEQNQEGN